MTYGEVISPIGNDQWVDNGRSGWKADILDKLRSNRQRRHLMDDQRLVRDDISTAIRRYLDVLKGTDGATLYDLAKALDELVATYHRVPDVEPDTTEGSAAPPTDESASST